MSKTEVHITHLLDITQGWMDAIMSKHFPKYYFQQFSMHSFFLSCFRASYQAHWGFGEEYNLNVLKEINVTESYLGLDQVIRYCDEKESLQDCKTKL